MGTSKFNGVNQLFYEQAKKEIKAGDILFCSGSYLVSELIKKASDSIFSHVGLLFFWNDRLVVLESVEDDGVRAVPLSHYLYDYENSKKKYNGKLYIGRHAAVEDPNFDKEKIKRMLGKAVDSITDFPERESPLLQRWDDSGVKTGVSLDALMFQLFCSLNERIL